MTTRELSIDRRDGVAVVTLNRPAARNAVNAAMAQAIVDAMDTCRSERVIVLTGADPAFCAGLDLRDLGIPNLADLPRFVDAVQESTVPVIAAVNGAAVTGGLELALACDFIVASERATFADTHLRVGVYPGPVAVDLPRRIGLANAREMSLTGNFVDAPTALRMGLVNHVVEHDHLLETALRLAGDIAEQDPALVALLRDDWRSSADGPLAEARRVHGEFRARADSVQTGGGLAERRAAVIERSRRQRDR